MMQHPDDRLLVSKLKEGNKNAFEILFKKYSAKLYNTISLLLYNKSLAKDLTQTTFMIVWEKRLMLDPDKNFQAYLYTISRNLVYKETVRLTLNNKYTEYKKYESEIIDDYIVEELNRAGIETYMNKLIESLPEMPQEIFRMKQEKGYSASDIANELNITERAVESHLYRTMKYLKEKLRDFKSVLLL
jgi:RNA polymerase sigma-70 factor (ECF subfamily)